MRYRTTILQTGGSTTGVPVPDDVLTALGQGKKPPVVVTLGGHTYRSTVAVRDGVAMIALSGANRAAAGVEGGQEVDVDVELDTAPRTVEVPDDLAAALATAGARDAFDRLAPSHRKAHVGSVEDARTPETRQRRIAAVVAKVTG
ncbi:YdeI/OmpD-associated family protein [Actinotalea solisilvae]|uniref:YdeI/OmpD-associated family protein n=1 Tax=Actinotalea solisilvae TaxID=2072922 RepID=UPI0018F24A8E|nr:YdeI/OmpD-associated family protein [Actinotalea solisilvae]